MPSVVRYTWNPDPVVLGDAIFAVDAALQNRALPLALAREQVQSDVRERFETETDPDGEPWQQWADSYADRAQDNAGILRKTDELYEAAISDEAVVISNDTVFYDSSVLPERGAWHQEGRPARKTKGGSPNPLPQRQFLGLSDAAVTVIFATFADWFDRAIMLYPTATGIIGRRHAMRGGGGMFVPRATPMPPRIR
jgi:phage gpG-like protein